MKKNSSIGFFLTIPAIPLAIMLAWLGLASLSTNVLGWFLLFVGGIYLVGGLLFIFIHRTLVSDRSEAALLEETGDHSFWWVLPGFLVIFSLAPVEYLYLGGSVRGSVQMQAAGFALVVSGFALLFWVQRVLKEYFTGHLQVVETQKLQTCGPYHYVRHPAYSGYLLISLGIAVGYGSLIGGAGFLFLLLPGFFYRIQVEERLLTARFGDDYHQYRLTTKRLFPGVW